MEPFIVNMNQILIKVVNGKSLHAVASTTMLAEQTQGYRISFELTKPVQSGFVGTMKLIINFVNSGLILH